ncbi:MAG TPA: hypothetical protein VFI02_04245 [Armatimonadota bacterium]|nr:hypothetical protein [Armatimonadota bacterium]
MKVGRRLRRIGRVLAYVLVFMPLVIAVLVVSSPLILRHMVNNRIAEIKARGEPITPSDLAGPKIPDSENGAVIYQKIFDRLEEPRFSNDREVLADFLSRKERAENPKLWDDTRDVIARYEWALPMVKTAASKPKCRFSVDWNAPPMEIKFPHLRKIMFLSYLTGAHAMIEAKEGNIGGANESIELGIRLGQSLKDEPHFLSQLSRLHVINTPLRILSDSLGYRAMDEDEARHLSNLLASIELRDGLRLGMISERALWSKQFELLRTEPIKSSDGSRDREPGPFWIAFTYANELHYQNVMNDCISSAKLPYRQAKPRFGTSDTRFPFLVSGILLPNFPPVHWDRAMAKVAGSQILLALHVHRNKYGSYPETLADLGKRLGWEIPTDPFSGKAFVYQRTGEGFVLYSIGPNLRDDGGLSEEEIERKHQLLTPPRPPKPENYDIVWTMDH